MKTLNDYISANINNTVMISLSVDNKESFQYNYWNWNNQELFLLKDDYTLGHILYDGAISQKDDGSIEYSHKYHPQKCLINFYFGGVK